MSMLLTDNKDSLVCISNLFLVLKMGAMQIHFIIITIITTIALSVVLLPIQPNTCSICVRRLLFVSLGTEDSLPDPMVESGSWFSESFCQKGHLFWSWNAVSLVFENNDIRGRGGERGSAEAKDWIWYKQQMAEREYRRLIYLHLFWRQVRWAASL